MEWAKVIIDKYRFFGDGRYKTETYVKVFEIPKWIFEKPYFKRRIFWICSRLNYLNYPYEHAGRVEFFEKD